MNSITRDLILQMRKLVNYIVSEEPDHATCHFAKSATIFKKVRDIVAKSDTYVKMRKEWRSNE